MSVAMLIVPDGARVGKLRPWPRQTTESRPMGAVSFDLSKRTPQS